MIKRGKHPGIVVNNLRIQIFDDELYFATNYLQVSAKFEYYHIHIYTRALVLSYKENPRETVSPFPKISQCILILSLKKYTFINVAQEYQNNAIFISDYDYIKIRNILLQRIKHVTKIN